MIPRSRLRRWLLVAAVFLVAFGFFGFLVAPGLLRSEVQKVLAQELGRPVTLGHVEINPFTLSARLHDLRIFEADGRIAALDVGEIDGGLSLTSLFRIAPVIDELTISAPVLHIVRLAPSRYSFSDIVERLAAPPKTGGDNPSKDKFEFALKNFHLTQGQIDFDDAVTHTHHKIEHITFALPLVSNIRHDIDLYEQPSLSATVDGSPVAISGKIKPFASSLDTTMAVHLERLDLPIYVGYSPLPLAAKVTSGQMTADLTLTFLRDANDLAHVQLSGQMSLDGLNVAHPDGSPAIAAKTIQVVIDQIDPFAPNIKLDRVAVLDPSIVVRRSSDGIDLARLLRLNPAVRVDKGVHTPSAQPNAAIEKPTNKELAFHIGHVMIERGRVQYADTTLAKPFATTFENIEIKATDVSNDRGKAAKISVALEGPNNQTLRADLEAALADTRVTGHVEAKNVRLDAYRAFWAPLLQAKVDDGSLDVSGDLRVSWAPENFETTFNHAAIKVSGLKLTLPAEKKPTLSADEIDLNGLDFDLSKRLVSFDTLHLVRPSAVISRDAHGALNILSVWAPKAAAATVRSAPQHPFEVAANAVSIEHASLTFTDDSMPASSPMRVENITLTAHNIRMARGARIPFDMSATAEPHGRVKLDGTLVASPFALDAQISAHQLDLAPLQGYFAQQLNVTLAHAEVSAQGHLKLAPEASPSITFGGAMSVDNVVALDKVNSAQFLRWRTLHFDHVHVVQPKRAAGTISLGNVTLSDFYSRLIVNPNGRFNLQDIIARPGQSTTRSVTTPESTNTSPAAEKIQVPSLTGGSKTLALVPAEPPVRTAPPAVIKMDSLTLDNGTINFTDNFIKPNYSTNVTALSGTVSAVSSDVAAPANITLAGAIEGNGNLEINGKINPLAHPLFLDIAASASNIELTGLTPYATKYAGYSIEKGKLSMKIKYHIENQRLEAQNNLFLDQLTFGPHVDSPSATKLPVLLAISLLKNSRGEINVDLPISGSLSDPKFSMGGVIVRVIINLLEKALTSPFQLLASIGGGSSAQELGFIDFAPGSATLDARAHAKLDRLAGSLAQRPALKLDITGHADPATDTAQARHLRLEGRVRGEKFRELLQSNPQARFEDVTVSASEYPKYLERLYKDMTFAKPTNFIGLTKSLEPAEMEKLILENMPINQDDLLSLAYRRSEAVSSALAAQGKVSAARIFLTAPKLTAAASKDKGAPNRVDFTLRP